MKIATQNGLHLCGAITLALSAHLAAQPVWLAAILLALIALRAVQIGRGGLRIQSWILIALAAGLIALVFQAHHSLIGRDGGMAAQEYLRSGRFTYTLEPPLLPGEHSIDAFLFDTRQGFCEHFAGAFAFLMRAADVPARIVTGYQGGEYNAAGRYLIVRQADAHAWVEVWLDGQGWQRIDPTAAAAPARIESGLARSILQGDELPLMLRGDASWIKSLRLQMDVMVNGWNQLVIGFDAERQRDLLRRIGISDFLSAQYLGWLLGAVGLLLGGFALLLLAPRSLPARDAASRAYQHFCRRLAAHGIKRQAQEGPQDFAIRASAALPHHADWINAVTADYLAVRYGSDPARLPSLRQRVRRRWKKQQGR